MTKIDILKRIVTEHQYETMLSVYQALNPMNQAKFITFSWPTMARVAFKLLAA